MNSQKHSTKIDPFRKKLRNQLYILAILIVLIMLPIPVWGLGLIGLFSAVNAVYFAVTAMAIVHAKTNQTSN